MHAGHWGDGASRITEASSEDRHRNLLPTNTDTTRVEMPRQPRKGQKRSTCVLTPKTLVSLGFRLFLQYDEGCMCGTTHESRVTIPRTSGCSAAATKNVPPTALEAGILRQPYSRTTEHSQPRPKARRGSPSNRSTGNERRADKKEFHFVIKRYRQVTIALD
jgi:hypothetical protein